MKMLDLVARQPPPADEASAAAGITVSGEPTTDETLLPFGPYRLLPVRQVAVMDPAYLAGLILAEVGSAALRAAAARALLTNGRHLSADGGGPVPGASAPIPLRPWALVLGAGVVVAVVLGLVDLVRPAGLPAAPTVAGSPTALAVANSSYVRDAGRSLVAQPPSAGQSGTRAAGTGSATSPPAPTPADACVARVPGAIAAVAAGEYLDTFQAVAFQVVATKDTGKVTFLNQ